MKILTIGGKGFIGSKLRHVLSDDHDIVDLDPRKTDIDSIDFQDYAVVIYMASSIVPTTNLDRFDHEWEELCKFKKIIEHVKTNLIFFSSGGAVYGNGYNIDERAELVSNSLYAFNKIAQENIIKLLSIQRSFKYTILRPSNVYGNFTNSKTTQGLIPNIINSVLNDQSVKVWGDGESMRDYIHLDDVIEAVKILLNRDFDNQIYNVSSGIGTTVNQILEMIARLSDKKILVERRENPLTIKHVTLSPDKLKTLGWTPKTNLENGIQQIWESKQIEFI
jgi:UDP-glucose 4-epimerase